jgi:hypothetical protein
MRPPRPPLPSSTVLSPATGTTPPSTGTAAWTPARSSTSRWWPAWTPGWTSTPRSASSSATAVVTDDTIRSLTVSQRALGTRSIALIHHTGCGLLSLTENFRVELEEEVGIRPSWALESFTDLEQDVRQSMARVRTSPFLQHRDDIRGFVFDVSTGLLREIAA